MTTSNIGLYSLFLLFTSWQEAFNMAFASEISRPNDQHQHADERSDLFLYLMSTPQERRAQDEQGASTTSIRAPLLQTMSTSENERTGNLLKHIPHDVQDQGRATFQQNTSCSSQPNCSSSQPTQSCNSSQPSCTSSSQPSCSSCHLQTAPLQQPLLSPPRATTPPISSTTSSNASRTRAEHPWRSSVRQQQQDSHGSWGTSTIPTETGVPSNPEAIASTGSRGSRATFPARVCSKICPCVDPCWLDVCDTVGEKCCCSRDWTNCRGEDSLLCCGSTLPLQLSNVASSSNVAVCAGSCVGCTAYSGVLGMMVYYCLFAHPGC